MSLWGRLERFHLTHASYYPYLRHLDFSRVEERLSQLNARSCLLTMERDAMKQRIIESRPHSPWRAYIARYGASDEEIVETTHLEDFKLEYRRIERSNKFVAPIISMFLQTIAEILPLDVPRRFGPLPCRLDNE